MNQNMVFWHMTGVSNEERLPQSFKLQISSRHICGFLWYVEALSSLIKLTTLNSISELDFESTLHYINQEYCPYSSRHQQERHVIASKELIDLWIQCPAKKNPKIYMMTHANWMLHFTFYFS